jgi:hypothetical protein
MEQHKQNSRDGSAAAAAPGLNTLEERVKESATPEQFCLEVARTFQVQPTEVALLRLEDKRLQFLFPAALKAAGSIPVSSTSAIAAHTAVTRKAECYNSFANVKHVSVFETVKLEPSSERTPPEKPIQRLMSAPILHGHSTVLGVIQVCRKGFDLGSSGPEFTPADLSQLERAATVAGKARFMRQDDAGVPEK